MLCGSHPLISGLAAIAAQRTGRSAVLSRPAVVASITRTPDLGVSTCSSSRSCTFTSQRAGRQQLQSVVASSSSSGQHSMSGKTDTHDLLIVGPGVLGSYLGKLWLEQYPDATVVGQTNTETSHASLKALGIHPRTKAQADGRKFPFVLFAAPPSGSEDYAAEVERTAGYWDGSGTLLFTSSAGVYAESLEGLTTEDSATMALGKGERTDRLLKAEQAVMEAGGCVVRLVGLYHAQRGAHTFFLKQQEVERWGGYIVNLIHYQDAASLSAAILRGDGADGYYRSKVFLGCDNTPVTFEDMMASLARSGAYEGGDDVKFVGPSGGPPGKRADNSATRSALSWQPQWSSFEEFMSQGAKDWYRS